MGKGVSMTPAWATRGTGRITIKRAPARVLAVLVIVTPPRVRLRSDGMVLHLSLEAPPGRFPPAPTKVARTALSTSSGRAPEQLRTAQGPAGNRASSGLLSAGT